MRAVGHRTAPREDSGRRIKVARGDLTGDKVTNTVECRKNAHSRNLCRSPPKRSEKRDSRAKPDRPKRGEGFGFEVCGLGEGHQEIKKREGAAGGVCDHSPCPWSWARRGEIDCVRVPQILWSCGVCQVGPGKTLASNSRVKKKPRWGGPGARGGTPWQTTEDSKIRRTNSGRFVDDADSHRGYGSVKRTVFFERCSDPRHRRRHQ